MIYHCNIYIIYICNSSSLTFPSPSLVEVKKQSTCSVHLTNLSDQYVAFKVSNFDLAVHDHDVISPKRI